MSLLKNFFVPHVYSAHPEEETQKVSAVIPAYRPGELTVRLVEDIIRWNDQVFVCVVDDCTSPEYEAQTQIFARIAKISDRVTVLRTPQNRLKAGAINHAIKYLLDAQSEQPHVPDVIVVMDDDVVIAKDTIACLTKSLASDTRLGAVCSQCRVSNKNTNLLTRLQGLEYFGFNALRLADEGFVYGPLVMHGMLTAFKTSALRQAGMFAEGHLIEDYEITVRLKTHGWHVRLAPYAYAWTEVPETFSALWRQRARWTVGGIQVLLETRHHRAIVQDIIGHVMFVATFVLVILSLMLWSASDAADSALPAIIFSLSIAQASVWYVFQLYFMRYYHERDWKDWALRALLIPEFLYANVLTLVLLGSYIFYLARGLLNRLERRRWSSWPVRPIERAFAAIGFSRGWGTRSK